MSSNKPTAAPARKSFAQVAAAANRSLKPNAEKPANSQLNPDQSIPKAVQAPNGQPSGAAPKILERPIEANATQPVSAAPEAGEPQKVEQINRLMASTTLESNVTQPSFESAPRKPASDTKSVTSRTTLTLDEKDSLRPDDSASMQAAVEDDGFSPGGSAVAGSKQSSDPDSRAFRDQLNEIDRTGSRHAAAQKGLPAENPPMVEPRNGGILYAPTPTAVTTTVAESFPAPHPTVAADVANPLPIAWNPPPDEKLTEALASPKDRLFVLKIEQDMIDFVKDSKEEYLQLPQTNSFYRMLSHKLADYYMLGHFIDDSMTSVRIYRTPNCRLPPPLIEQNPAIDGSTPPPNAPTRKIMRRNRGRDGKQFEQGIDSDKNVDSLTSSKATSDIGASNTPDEAKETPNGSGDKSALTREERESRYNEARARIFKDFDAQENAELVNAQADKGLSRSSSASGVKKSKKANRKPKDDGFEARSAFDQYGQRIVPHDYSQTPQTPQGYATYPQFGHPGYSSGHPGIPIAPAGHMAAYNTSDGYAQFSYNPWAQGYPHPHNGGMHETFNVQSYHPMNGYDASAQYSTGHLNASQATPKGNAPSLASYQQGYMPQNEAAIGWAQHGYMNPYSPMRYGYSEANAAHETFYAPQRMQPASPPAQYGNFPGQHHQFFGQTPPYANFNHPHFNPRSQNFVPAARGGPLQGFAPEPGMPYSNSHAGLPHGESAMQRQPSNNSHGSSFSPVPVTHQATPRVNSNGQGQQRSRGQQLPLQSSISKWSTPANLPAKPPPPAVISPYEEVARDPENQRPLPPKPFSSTEHVQNGTKNLAIR